jgi:transcriptional regulator with XRE-family HTH domain
MIAAQIVTEVRRLLREEILSQRKIAWLMGVSRTTVAAIASGKRPDYDLLRQLRDDEWEEPTGPAVRCPGCGGRVHMPCQLCRTRKRIAEKRHPYATGCACASLTGLASAAPRCATGSASAVPPRGPVAEDLEPLGVNLRPEHRARYEEVRAWRIRNEQLATSTAMLTPRTSPLTSQGA